MKKQLIYVMLAAMASITHCKAQPFTTYYCGFDTPAERAGWTQYRMAAVTFTPWFTDQSAYGTGSCLTHTFPAFISSVLVMDDWFVSPAFTFSVGGNIDSLRFNFSAAGTTPGPYDTVAVFLLKGSSNPMQATQRVKLVDFRGSEYVKDGTWKLKTNIPIPSATGNSYIAFKYHSQNRWLDVKFDNLAVKIYNTTGVAKTNFSQNDIEVYPNPAKKVISFKTDKTLHETVDWVMYTTLGEKVMTKKIDFNMAQTVDLPNGIYNYELKTLNGQRIKNGKIVVNND